MTAGGKPGAAIAGEFFAVAAPGLEPITAQELQQLGLPAQVMPGGAAFRGRPLDLYRANLHLRTASRVLVRVGEFYAAAFAELRKKAGRLPWEQYLQAGGPVAIHATCHKSKLYHSDGVAERVAGAIGDRLGQAVVVHKARPDAAGEVEQGNGGTPAPTEATVDRLETPPLVVVRLVRDLCTLSVDSSGALLHQRGYRLAGARAPLRETLAAGLLLAATWDRQSPLLDPFCGAGTIPIEAALLALGLAPGRARRFAFMDWPNFDAALWQALLAEAQPKPGRAPAIIGSDRDAGAVAAALENAARAGVAEHVKFERRSVSALEAPQGRGWVVTNPPYGVRIRGQADLRNLYARFGQVLRARCPGWQVALLNPDRRLAQATGLPLDLARSLTLTNGGLRVSLFQAHVPEAKQ